MKYVILFKHAKMKLVHSTTLIGEQFIVCLKSNTANAKEKERDAKKII